MLEAVGATGAHGLPAARPVMEAVDPEPGLVREELTVMETTLT